MSNVTLQDYYDRYDPDKGYDRILFRDTRVLQGAELNEMQRILGGRMRGVVDALFKDGDIIRDAQVTYDENNGQANCQAGLIYLAGAVRQVEAAVLTVPNEGVRAIGVFLSNQVITELEDPGLYNPAIGVRGEGEPGAARLKVTAQWGLSTDVQPGDFYPVHTVEDGQIQAKEPPPNLDSLTQALARYDRDSAGGTYVVSGLTVRQAPDTDNGLQVYTVSEGRARVYGYPVELTTSRRLVFSAEPDLLEIESEPHLSAGGGDQRIDLDRYPVGTVHRVRVTREKTATLTHGGYTGCHDPLPDNPVVELLEIKQGAVTYVAGNDYKLTAGKIDWSPPGQEPAPHSTFTVKYRYISTETVDEADLAGFNIEGAVPGSQIFVDYTQVLPRLDRLCLNRDGSFIWVRGVAAEWIPQAPAVSDDLLPLATIQQTWDDKRRVLNDGVRVVPMDDIAAINTRLDGLTEHVAQQRLTADIFTREAGAKKGLFVDPFLSDQMRDQGLAQTGAIVGGVLTLPIAIKKIASVGDGLSPWAMNYTPATALEQLLITGSMRVNPYDAFDPMPAIVELNPAIDRWTDIESQWASPVTETFNAGHYVPGARVLYVGGSSTTTTEELLSSSSSALEYLRRIEVGYKVTGFGPGETLSITFDGLPVTPSQNKADANGVAAGFFTIPEKIPAGSKSVVFTGSGGSQGSAVFVGQGALTVQTLRQTITTTLFWIDPLAQTFVLMENAQLCAVDLWFTAKHTSRVVVQIRETTVGIPNQTVLGESIVDPSQITVGGSSTRIFFKAPVTLAAETEYALVIMCDDAVTSVAIAELGKWDLTQERWVTAQPYQVGVLLSSSNASTWTAHQDRDLTFRLLKAVYSPTQAELEIGRVETPEATDLVFLPVAEQPSAHSRAEYRLAWPDNSLLTAADGQPMRLNRPTAGPITVKAKLTATASMAPILYPGAQLICGLVAEEADYITRAVPAGAGSRVKVILDADLPAGASVTAFMCPDGQSTWSALEFSSSRNLDDGWRELIFEAPTNALLVRIKLVLSGSSSARPRVDNLRVLTI